MAKLHINVRQSKRRGDNSYTVHMSHTCSVRADSPPKRWRLCEEATIDRLAKNLFFQACERKNCWTTDQRDETNARWLHIRPSTQPSEEEARVLIDAAPDA